MEDKEGESCEEGGRTGEEVTQDGTTETGSGVQNEGGGEEWRLGGTGGEDEEGGRKYEKWEEETERGAGMVERGGLDEEEGWRGERMWEEAKREDKLEVGAQRGAWREEVEGRKHGGVGGDGEVEADKGAGMVEKDGVEKEEGRGGGREEGAKWGEDKMDWVEETQGGVREGAAWEKMVGSTRRVEDDRGEKLEEGGVQEVKRTEEVWREEDEEEEKVEGATWGEGQAEDEEDRSGTGRVGEHADKREGAVGGAGGWVKQTEESDEEGVTNAGEAQGGVEEDVELQEMAGGENTPEGRQRAFSALSPKY